MTVSNRHLHAVLVAAAVAWHSTQATVVTAEFLPADTEVYLNYGHVGTLSRAVLSSGSADDTHGELRRLQREQQGAQEGGVPQLPTDTSGHCQVVKGDWCGGYYTQTPITWTEAPRGDKSCPADCNSGIGTCDYDTGRCYCPAGYGGLDCTQPRTRDCWNMGPDRRDKGWRENPTWVHSRCAGLCDVSLAMCYCPPETKHGLIPAPPGSPLGTPPIKKGRPMFWCQPATDAEGVKIHWGAVKWEDLLGNGTSWCDADMPSFKCPCRLDGWIGDFCQIPVEQMCPNQCGGHGQCDLGFCRCHKGWYGHDCARKRAGEPMEPGDEEQRKWLRAAMVKVPAAQVPVPHPTRRRPLVYVYDMLPAVNSDVLQYRIERGHCQWRIFELGNVTQYIGYNAYAIESALHEMFLTSSHRTFDPKEADYFFVPTQAACLFDVVGWNAKPSFPDDIPGSWSDRTYHSGMMLRAAAQWLEEAYPQYWRRRGGRDHIWLMAHDEGACYAPIDVWPGVMLSHWGRTDMPHVSHSQYHGDNYSKEQHHHSLPGGWLAASSKAHPCFDPSKDLVIPAFKAAHHWAMSPYMGAARREREVLLFFRGDVGKTRHDPRCVYSRCIRQRVYNMSRDEGWREKFNVLIGDASDVPGGYGELLSSSIFCLVMPGDGWSPRMEDAMLHGCIPVIIQDNVQVPFENLLDMPEFSLRVAEKDIPRLLEIVRAVTPQEIHKMQGNVDRIWQRFRYMHVPLNAAVSKQTHEAHRMAAGGAASTNPGSQYATSSMDDAFSTILEWLHWRMPHVHAGTRGGAGTSTRRAMAQAKAAAGATTIAAAS